MCVAEQTNSGLHPRIRGYKGLADQLLLRARTHMSVADSGVTRVRRPSVAASIHICIEGCMQASKFYQGFADQLHCERTHVGCRMNHLRIAPKDQGLQRFRRPIAAATMCVAK